MIQSCVGRQVGTASLTGMMLDDSTGSGNVDPLEWVQRQEVDELKVWPRGFRVQLDV